MCSNGNYEHRKFSQLPENTSNTFDSTLDVGGLEGGWREEKFILILHNRSIIFRYKKELSSSAVIWCVWNEKKRSAWAVERKKMKKAKLRRCIMRCKREALNWWLRGRLILFSLRPNHDEKIWNKATRLNRVSVYKVQNGNFRFSRVFQWPEKKVSNIQSPMEFLWPLAND